jgi:23S rRNA (pseudouridine1915-N3)-methyltransferase
MEIKIIGVGKIKKSYLDLAFRDYLTKLAPFAKIVMFTVPAVSDSTTSISKINELEGEALLAHVMSYEFVITLDLHGTSMDSLQFASLMKERVDKSGSAPLTFIVGGSNGLGANVKARANASLCLSNLTFLHEHVYLLLLEQIYRSFQINNHKTYHK